MLRALLLTTGALWCCSSAAQFYAPQTDFHDPAQRFFPVEAARVIAWRANLTGGKISEVTWKLIADRREIVWTIEWRSGADKVTRQATVRYPEASLTSGAEWYREVWKQLGGSALRGTSGESAVAPSFWEGMEAGGLSRMEGISAALRVVEASPRMDKAADAAKLSGTLFAAGLPALGTPLSLDCATFARCAAWLCVAEEQAGALPRLWAPVIALSGRSSPARALWQKPGDSRAELFCDLLIRFPAATEALPLISRPENRHFAAPLFSAYSDAETTYGQIFVEVGQSLYPKEWDKLSDYGPDLNFATKNRPPIARDFAAKSLRAWLETLRRFSPPPGDDTEAPAMAEGVKDFDQGKSDISKPSPELAALLNRSLEQGMGPLVPVAVVTARDLLNFGWDIGGLQMSSIYNSMVVLSGFGRPAQELAEPWLTAVHGWNIFFSGKWDKPYPTLEDTGRCELILRNRIATALIEQPPASWDGADDDTYFRRRWLMDPHRALEFYSELDGPAPRATELIRRALSEGSPARLGSLLNPEPQCQFDEKVDELGLRAEIARVVPMNVVGPQALITREFEGKQDPFALAQALERLQWATGIVFDSETIFLNYVGANALDSARRYYERSQAAIAISYIRETNLGPARFALALLENDEPGRKRVMSDCGTTIRRKLEIADALLREDYAAAKKHVDEWIKKFGDSKGLFALFRDYLPLVPALQDRKHPDHDKALRAFPKASYLLFLPAAP